MAPAGPPAAKGKAAPKSEGKPKAKAKKQEERDPVDAIPKVNQPDRNAFDEKVKVLNEKVDELQKELSVANKKISEKSTGKDEFFAQKAELRRQLDEISGKMDAIQAQKDGHQKQVGERQAEGKQMRQDLNKFKKSLGYTSEEQIEERIATIEFQMWTQSLSLKDEKKYLAEIQELKRSRPKVSQYHKLEAEVASFDAGGNIREQVQSLNAQLATHREAKREVQAQYAKLMEERQAQLGNMPELFEDRERLNKLIGEKIRERNALRDEFRAEEQKYNAYLAEIRKIRQERAQEQRAERQKEYEVVRKQRQVEKLEDNPYVSEIALVEQTMLWCRSMLPKEGAAKVEKKATDLSAKEGEEILISKDAREEEFYFAPTKGKKAKGKAKDKKDDGNIKHNMETFRLFDQLKLDAPITTAEIPPLLEKLSAQMTAYEEKVAAWEKKRDEVRKRIDAGEDIDDILGGGKKEKDAEEAAPAEEAPKEEAEA